MAEEDLEALRLEKEKAERKLKLMADIVEKLSKKPETSSFDVKAIVEPRIKEINDKLEFKTQEIEKALASIEERLKKPEKGGKDVSSLIKTIEPRLAKLEEVSKNFESISELQKKINELIEKQSQPKEQKPQHTELANYDTIMSKISSLESRINSQDIEKIKEFLNSKNSIIKAAVEEEAEKKFGYVLRGLEELEAGVRKLGKEVMFSLKEIDAIKADMKALSLVKEDLLNFKKEKENLYATIDVRMEEMERFIEKTKKNVKIEMKDEIKDLSSAIENLRSSISKIDAIKKDVENKIALLRNETDRILEERVNEVMDVIGKNMNEMMGDVEKRFLKIGKPLNEEMLKSAILKERDFIKKIIDSKTAKIEKKLSESLKNIENRLAKNEERISNIEKNMRLVMKSRKEMSERMKKRESEIKRLLEELR